MSTVVTCEHVVKRYRDLVAAIITVRFFRWE